MAIMLTSKISIPEHALELDAFLQENPIGAYAILSRDLLNEYSRRTDEYGIFMYNHLLGGWYHKPSHIQKHALTVSYNAQNTRCGHVIDYQTLSAILKYIAQYLKEGNCKVRLLYYDITTQTYYVEYIILHRDQSLEHLVKFKSDRDGNKLEDQKE